MLSAERPEREAEPKLLRVVDARLQEEAVNGMLHVPPQAVEVEKHVIGAMMLDPEAAAIAAEKLQEGDFYLEKHRVIFVALCSLFTRGAPTDVLSMVEELKRENKYAHAGGERGIMEISGEVVSAASITEHCDIVKEKSVLRGVIAAATHALEEAYAEGARAEDVVAEAESGIFAISQMVTAQTLGHLRGALSSTMEQISQRRQGVVPGIPTGITEFDKVSGGLRKTASTILAGRTGMGKTALALNIAGHAAECHKVALFSLEMSKEEICVRLLGSASGVNNTKIDLGRMHDGELGRVGEAALALSHLHLWIDDSPSQRPVEILSKCKRMKAREGLDLIVVDYLQLLDANERRRGMSREQEVSECSRFLKRIAMELDVAVLCLSQLSRETEKRHDKRPMLSDLRESGAIEQDANVVLFIHRPDQYDQSAEMNRAELIIGKGRGIPKFDVSLTFIPENTRFVDYKKPDASTFMHGAEAPRPRYGD